MNIHEYQGKSLLKKMNVLVPEGIVADSPEKAVEAAIEIQRHKCTNRWAIKAQIHAGGRGKGGGVKIAKTLEEVREFASQILGMQLVTPQTGPKGKKVRMVLVEQNIYYKGKSETLEFYMSIMLNRASGKDMIMYSPKGGMDIEKVANESPEEIFREEIDPRIGLKPFQCRKIAFNLNLSGIAFVNMVKFIKYLYDAYLEYDASLFEINPVIKAADDKIFAADTKVVIDNNALYRHREIEVMRDLYEEDPSEVEAGKFDLNYIKLDGNVGCMVNGAGLAMATMDVIKLSGGNPANFLDIGGAADSKRVEEGFRIIMKDTNVKAIFVNIFGGIVRVDEVAQGIVDACKNLGNNHVPIIVRLQGTNVDTGNKILNESKLRVHSADRLDDAVKIISEVIN
ncbi:MAG: ADP-forming succinate--CoA ligase subunit beta [Bacteroidales bacterium]|nr:ADP-forming succinate--CoA ligase subunit beta [Bacteroidales bacterium]